MKFKFFWIFWGFRVFGFYFRMKLLGWMVFRGLGWIFIEVSGEAFKSLIF
jgi:hypothetical protein